MSPTLWLVASSVGLVALVVLGIVYRRAAARRELELAEAALDAEYTALAPRCDATAIEVSMPPLK